MPTRIGEASERCVRQRLSAMEVVRRDVSFGKCGYHTQWLFAHLIPGFCQKFAAKSIKAIRVKDEASLTAAQEYDVDAILLDTYTDSSRGGTGKTFDWALAKKAQELLTPPIILSGGLNPENVTEAIRLVQPYAVDVASGVEREPGKKDPEKLRRFFEACKRA